MNPATMTDRELSAEIIRYQKIQAQSAPNSDNWKDASIALSPLFKEAVKRATNGSVIESM